MTEHTRATKLNYGRNLALQARWLVGVGVIGLAALAPRVAAACGDAATTQTTWQGHRGGGSTASQCGQSATGAPMCPFDSSATAMTDVRATQQASAKKSCLAPVLQCSLLEQLSQSDVCQATTTTPALAQRDASGPTLAATARR